MKRTLLLFFTIIFITLYSGCMAFRGAEFTDLSQIYPERVSQIPKSDLRVQTFMNARHYANGVVWSASSKTQNIFIGVLEKVLNDQHMFKEIGMSVSDPDWSVKFDIREEEHFNEILSALSGATLVLIPFIDYVEISAKATVYDKDGKELATLKSKQDVKYVFQTLFLFLAPWRDVICNQARQNLIKDIVLQLGELSYQKG